MMIKSWMKHRKNKRLQQEARAWVIRLASGEANERDAKAFKNWCMQSTLHASAFKHARQVWGDMQPAASIVMQQDIHRQHQLTARRLFVGGAVFASVAYLSWRPPLGLWDSVPDMLADAMSDFKTGVGEQRSVIVADGVQVQMNTMTRLNVVSDTQQSGLVVLAGEAQIQADLGNRDLLVRAGNGTVVASKALFNIRLADDDVCVTCLEGRINVIRSQDQRVLMQGQQLTYRADVWGRAVEADTSAVSAWRQRMLVFQDTPLFKVVDEVNRYRGGKIVLRGDNLRQVAVQANFSLDRLDDVIALIRDAYGANVTYLPGGVVLLREMSA